MIKAPSSCRNAGEAGDFSLSCCLLCSDSSDRFVPDIEGCEIFQAVTFMCL